MNAVVKAEKRRREELGRCGITLDVIRAERKEPRLFLCAIRGLLIFMGTFGTLGGIVSAFELDYRMAAVAVIMFIVSMVIALIYFNKVTFYVGYLLLLAGFAWFSARYFLYINSGFQAFLNVSAKVYGNYFHLPALREATELIGDRYETVSMLMIFLGIVFALLLNISISAYMSLIMTFLITFLPLQVAFYVERKVPLPYLIMLLTVYISVMMLKRSGNFALPSKYGKEHIFETKFERIRRSFGKGKTKDRTLASENAPTAGKKKIVHKYLVSGSGMISVAAIGALISVIFMSVMNGMLTKTAKNDEITNSVKVATDEYVKTIAQGGLSALFNRYDATGGLSRGRLGGIGTVNPDFQTDLILRFVPYSAESMYLRTYVGKTYGDNRFWPGFSTKELDDLRKIINFSGKHVPENGWGDDDYIPALAGREDEKPVNVELSFNPVEVDNGGSLDDIILYSTKSYTYEGAGQLGWEKYGKIWICNVGADMTGEYLPYFSFSSDTTKRQEKKPFSEKWKAFSSGGNVLGIIYDDGFVEAYNLLDDQDTERSFAPENALEVYEGLFLPYQSSTYYQPNPTVSKEYESYVYSRYLDVPEELRESLNKITAEAGIDAEAAEANMLRNKYEDAFFSFMAEIASDKYGLTDSEKEKAVSLYNSIRYNMIVIPASSDIIGILGDPEALKEYLGTDTSDHFITLLKLKAENHRKNAPYDASEEEWVRMCDFLIELYENNRDKFPEETYSYAADAVDYEDYLKMQKLRLQILRELKAFYRNEFSYTLSPGRTPLGEDVVEYFLTKRRRGYCAHFASSACLLLRSLGIPSRYVEGYVVHGSDVTEAKVVDEDISKWKYGDYGFVQSAVVEAEVSDASAHAWVEVYIDGYGWIPYEMTPPSDEDQLGGGILGFLSGIITGRQRQQMSGNNSGGSQTEDYSDTAEQTKSEKSVFAGISFLLIPLLWLIGIGFTIAVCIFAIKRVLYLKRLKKLEKNDEYNEALLIRYRKMLGELQRKGFVNTENPTVSVFFDEICENAQRELENEAFQKIEQDAGRLAKVINRAAFADVKTEREEYFNAVMMMRSIRRSLIKNK